MPPGGEGTLAAASAVAATALAGLEEETGNVFGPRRVIVLFCDNLSGRLPAGELTGDDVIVVTSHLPTAAASAAQAELLGAGAAQAAVVGPEVTSAQLDELVSADLSQGARSDSVSAPVLFGNDSYALEPTAISVLEEIAAEAARTRGDRGDQRVRLDPGHGRGQLHLVLPAGDRGRPFSRGQRDPGVVADHRGSRRLRYSGFGDLGREPPGAGGHRETVRQGLSCFRHGPREPALTPVPRARAWLAAEGLGQVVRTVRRLRGAGLRSGDVGLAAGGQVSPDGVPGRFPVAPAPLPGRGGQGRPVLVSQLRSQSSRGTFGAKGRVGPAQGAPDPVPLGTADWPQLVLHHLDPAFRQFIQRELELQLGADPVRPGLRRKRPGPGPGGRPGLPAGPGSG